MKREEAKLHSECHTCLNLEKGNCKGKETNTPCLGYKSAQVYIRDVINGIKMDLEKNKGERE